MGGKVIINVNAVASSYSSGAGAEHTAPEWTISIHRDSASSSAIKSWRKTGVASNVTESDSGGPPISFRQSSLTIDEVFIDGLAPSTEVYYLKVTRHGGTPTTITVKHFEAESPSFLTNTLDKAASANTSWTDKETGFTIKSGWKSVRGNGTATVTFGDSFTTIYSATANATFNNFNGWSVGTTTSVSNSRISIQNQDNSTRILRWIAIGYTAQ
jgi:hypothetical protein